MGRIWLRDMQNLVGAQQRADVPMGGGRGRFCLEGSFPRLQHALVTNRIRFLEQCPTLGKLSPHVLDEASARLLFFAANSRKPASTASEC